MMAEKINGPKCLCGSNEYRIKQKGHYTLQGKQIDFSLLVCTICGLKRTYPLPISHNNRYEEEQNAEGVIRNETEVNRAVFSLLASDLISVFKHYKKSGNLLDFGCGSGVLLREASPGFTPYGIELSERLKDFCKNSGINTLEEQNLLSDSFENFFDVIVMSQVMEHLYDPQSTLKLLMRTLKKDGVFVISVPNNNTILSKIQGVNYFPLQPECHLWHFTSKTFYRNLTIPGLVFSRSIISSRDFYFTKFLTIIQAGSVKEHTIRGNSISAKFSSFFMKIHKISGGSFNSFFALIIKVVFKLLCQARIFGDNLIIVARKS